MNTMWHVYTDNRTSFSNKNEQVQATKQMNMKTCNAAESHKLYDYICMKCPEQINLQIQYNGDRLGVEKRVRTDK